MTKDASIYLLKMPNNLPIQQEAEFLKREEIKTMARDIAGLREMEAKTEKERIIDLKPAEIKSQPHSPSSPSPILPPVPPAENKPSFSFPYKKIIVRGIIILISLALLGFGFWFWQSKKPAEKKITPPSQTETPPPQTELFLPPSLILTKDTKLISISNNEEIPVALEQLVKTEIPIGSFSRVAIKNSAENRWVYFNDLISIFKISSSPEISEKLDPDFTLLLFSQKEGGRTALVAKTTDSQGLINLLKNWGNFKVARSQGISFKYLTLAKNDLGIVYLVLDNYFVLTNSFESMEKVINELTLEKKLGQLFLVGFEGKTLTPELAQFLKKYRPGGLLLLSKNIENKDQLKKLISDVQKISLKETGLPLFIAVDQEGGQISRVNFLEELTPQSEIDSQEMAFQVGQKRGQELKDMGINLNLAPLLDQAGPTDFLFNRSFQKDSLEIGGLSKLLISGQKTAGILTAIKHFPGYADISQNPEETLIEKENIPEISQFQIALEANPELVMTANVIYKDIDADLPFTFSVKAIQFLKEKLNENILIISDDLSQNSLLGKFSLRDIISKPIEAGVDIMIFSGYKAPVEQGLDEFLNAFGIGEISKEKVETAIVKIIKLKQGL